ncbi:MAG TPA: hypothetical protein VEV44_12820 [Pseudoneobacillus sp.]|nr:hypothetical protein [Pseudoneobacillus sp.]
MEMIYTWGTSLQKNSSILLFLQSHKILLSFEIDNETIFVLFQNGVIDMTKQAVDDIPDALIKGDKGAIEKLLTGDLLLRELISLKQIFVQSSFRKLLFLESLFKLAHLQFNSEISKKQLDDIENGVIRFI